MRIIIGYGNKLRGADAFGIDVINELQNITMTDTKLLSLFQLTPELVLELLDADEIIFIDACYDIENNYALACSITEQNSLNLTHHISYKVIIEMLNTLYDKYPTFQVYSMLTNNFENIKDISEYNKSVQVLIFNIGLKTYKIV